MGAAATASGAGPLAVAGGASAGAGGVPTLDPSTPLPASPPELPVTQQEWPSIHVLVLSPPEPVAPEPVPPEALPVPPTLPCPCPWPASPDAWSLAWPPWAADESWAARLDPSDTEPTGASAQAAATPVDATSSPRASRARTSDVRRGPMCLLPWVQGKWESSDVDQMRWRCPWRGNFSLSAIIRLPRVKPVTLRRIFQGKRFPKDGQVLLVSSFPDPTWRAFLRRYGAGSGAGCPSPLRTEVPR